MLDEKPSPRPEEQEITAMVKGTFTEAHKIGRNEGRTEGTAHALLTVLCGRGIAVPDAARDRILAERDPGRLEHSLEEAGIAPTVAELLDEPS